MNIRDLPEYGLVLLGPSEPSFDSLLSLLANGKQGPLAQQARPFSVVIQNKSGHTVVAYCIRWELLNERSQKVHHDVVYEDIYAFSDRGKEATPPPARTYALIEPGGMRLVSWAFDASVRSDAPGDAVRFQRSVDRATEELRTSQNLTIILDGAFFEDGSFVGPNDTGFFDVLKAQVDARQDLMAEIDLARRRGNPPDQVFNLLRLIVDAPQIRVAGLSSSPAEFYQFYRREFAVEVLSVRKAGGDQAALGHVFRSLYIQRPNLYRKR